MRCAPPAGRGFSPLDEELALRPGRYSPYVQQCVVRLGTWLPFEQVPEALAWFTQVPVGRETARRLTERAGAALVAPEPARVEQLEQDWPAPVAPLTLHQLSVDGAMVPLVHGEWAEVKPLAIGRVVPRGGFLGFGIPGLPGSTASGGVQLGNQTTPTNWNVMINIDVAQLLRRR